ncbi:nonsense-mediated mRNA decay factor SMG7-like [Battus philenor]|uniref:nonsense-mediated mRNA decay factor SMG7-like n=1 Tax=Battus philenor TaxID=42288 RepID=UPI0035CFD9A8
MVLNAAVQMLREADELKSKILKFNSGTSMLQDRSLWTTQQQLQNVYQKILMLDLDYALDKKVEQDLWNVGFKQQIEALQSISKDRKNPLRSEGQAMLSWVLQAAAGFYLCLLHQICTSFKLDLPFRRRASLLGSVEAWGPGATAAPAAARYASQHCLVHLGDLARYRQQLRVAHTFYRHALAVSPHSGQPYNQLALVAWRRGRRLAALYWHVRSLLVRAPFPPAPTNLARTLAAASREVKEAPPMPVLPGLTNPVSSTAVAKTERLDAHSYITELIRAANYIHTVEQLDTASTLVNTLNTSLTPLVATNSFEPMTLIKMSCVLIWLVQSSSEECAENALSADEATAARLAAALAASTVLSLLLPSYTASEPPKKALPALKVWLHWMSSRPQALETAAWRARPQLWPALAHVLAALTPRAAHLTADLYDTVPLPEDEELHGFLPLEEAFKGLKFSYHTTWDTYGGRLPELEAGQDGDTGGSPSSVAASCFSSEPGLEDRVRAHRLVQLGKRLAEQHPDLFTCTTEEDGGLTFAACSGGGEQLTRALAELSMVEREAEESRASDTLDDSEDEPAPPPPPVIISEADFREKVREKRVGILKPQGSLERAREERALATTQDDQGVEEDGKGEDKKEARKPRVNIAMAAIMRKQEETNKQVKFASPPPTPDSVTDASESSAKEADKPKVLQPKAIKSLTNLPIGRKTGGILSLKDKSAGYPHLVNTDPEPPKKADKDERKDTKPVAAVNQTAQQNFQPKWQEHTPQTWPMPPQQFNEPRMGFQKNYGIQNTGISYNPNYQAAPGFGQGIRLPVVNPKEIDVRTAALQKQTSRPELFQEGHKFTNHGYQMSGDKKNFLNDLPPRFANQYRYWQNAQDNQPGENKFRDDSFKSNAFEQQPLRNWSNQQPDYQQPMTWWKPENTPLFNTNFSTPINIQPNYFSPHISSNTPNPYLNHSYNQNQGQKLDSVGPNWQPTIGQPQIPTLQNLVTSPSFSASLNNFGSYAPSVGYDTSMYPQFSSKLGFQPMQVKTEKPYQGKEMDEAVNFAASVMDMQQRNMNFNAVNQDAGVASPLDQIGGCEGTSAGAGNTYSLFSAATEPAAWTQRQPHQSLWSGPGPSPLERLLEQQKQMKQPPTPQ